MDNTDVNISFGDVLRIYSGDFKLGEIGGKQITQGMYFGIAMFMVIPIVMDFMSITLNNPANHWLNIIIPIVLLVFRQFFGGLEGWTGFKGFIKLAIDKKHYILA